MDIKIDGHWLSSTLPRGGSISEPILYDCNMPFKSLNIDLNGLCYLCVCEAWLPISVGNILDFNRLEDVWANPIAQRLQQDIKERKYTHCAVRHCGVLEGPVELSNFNLGINIDESCNLACPSCRKSAINHTGGEIFNIRQEYVNHLIKLIQDFNQPMNLVMCGNGDPLASLIMRPLILNWKPKDNQTITLRTNGLLMRKLLPDSLVLPQIKIFEISVDAGSQEVYENVRRPGKFSVLQENLQWLSENRPTNSKVHLLMCVQKSNANDIINFADMCKKYGFVASFTKLEDWHTFANFEEHDVIGNINHPLRDTALNELRTVYNMSHVYLNPLLKNLL